MAEDGQLARFSARSGPTKPTLSELLDPHALEERLKEARSRRAEALARKAAAAPDGDLQTVVQSPRLVAPRPLPVPESPAPRPAAVIAPPVIAPPAVVQPEIEHAVAPAAEPAARRQAGAYFALIFLAGLGLGGAAVAVLALRSLPDRIAAVRSPRPHRWWSAPVATPDPAPAPAPVAAPVAAAVPAPVPSAVPPATQAAPPQAPATAGTPAGASRRRPPWRCASTAPRRRPRPAEPAAEAAPAARPGRRAPAPTRAAARRRARRLRSPGADAAASPPPADAAPPRSPPPTLPPGRAADAAAPRGRRCRRASSSTIPPSARVRAPRLRDALAAAGGVRRRDRPGPLRHRPQQHPLLPRRRPPPRRRPRRFVAPALAGEAAGGARLHRLRHPDRPRQGRDLARRHPARGCSARVRTTAPRRHPAAARGRRRRMSAAVGPPAHPAPSGRPSPQAERRRAHPDPAPPQLAAPLDDPPRRPHTPAP